MGHAALSSSQSFVLAATLFSYRDSAFIREGFCNAVGTKWERHCQLMLNLFRMQKQRRRFLSSTRRRLCDVSAA
jgi:hypothetical protein